MFGSAIRPSKHTDKQHGSRRDARRAELQDNRLSKHQEKVGLSVAACRQGAQMFGNTKPFTFLRVKFGGTVVSSLLGESHIGFYLRGDQMDKMIDLTEACEALVDLFW